MAGPGHRAGGRQSGWRSTTLRWLRRAGMALVVLASSFLLLDRIFPPPLPEPGDASFMVVDRGGRPVAAFGTPEGRWRLPVSLEKVDPVFVEALIAYEDKRFHGHPGVDPVALLRAAGSAVREGEIVSGASTLTMQTARLLEPRPDRTIGAKLIEMFRAVQIEVRLSKREILELYLTLAPYGGNLEGLRAASWAYFGREPDRLSDAEIALLIALPQSPEVRRPDIRPDGAQRGRQIVVDKLARLGVFSARRAREALETPLPARRAFPASAWHYAERLRREMDSPVAVASLDLGLQEDLEALLSREAENLEPETQLAAIVVHIPSRGVRAMVGAAERDRPGGWIDLSDRRRSPGSTLKPFIYGLAFDDGVASPATLISDLPKRFDSYRPENFDRSFRGDVRVSDALAHSLNVPAVLTLDRVGPERFAAQLSFAGVYPRIHGMARRKAGLALALGGAGMTLEELAMLYAGLGDGGRVKPLAWSLPEEAMTLTMHGARLMSAESAAQILSILKAAPAPAGRMPARLTVEAPDIAFKTGTSYGFRDAWAAGVSGDYAAVVWIGRADGAPRPGETGRRAALPVLFEVFDRTFARLGRSGGSENRLRTPEAPPAPGALARFEAPDRPPEILFPPEGSELWAAPDRAGHPRRFVLAGRAETDIDWYINGDPAGRDAAGAPVWTPEKPGFFEVSAVDAEGRASTVSVRVIGIE